MTLPIDDNDESGLSISSIKFNFYIHSHFSIYMKEIFNSPSHSEERGLGGEGTLARSMLGFYILLIISFIPNMPYAMPFVLSSLLYIHSYIQFHLIMYLLDIFNAFVD